MDSMSALATIILATVGASVTVIGALVTLGWWLGQQFRTQSNELNKNIYQVRDKLVETMNQVEDKLETQIRAHEKLDDERFKNLELRMLKFDFWSESQGRTGPHEI